MSSTMISVDLQTNSFSVSGKSVRVAPMHAELLTMLEGRYRIQDYITYEAIEFGLYGNTLECDRPADPLNVIAVMACNLRKKLKPHGYDIKSVFGRGLYLVHIEEMDITLAFAGAEFIN